VATAMKLAGKSTSVRLLIVGEEMTIQTVPIEKFDNIFSVGDKLDRAKYRALRYIQQTVKGPLRSSLDIKVCVRPDRYHWNQDNATPATEKRSLRMDVRQSWSTVSKVELRSSRTSGTTSPQSIDWTVSL